MHKGVKKAHTAVKEAHTAVKAAVHNGKKRTKSLRRSLFSKRQMEGAVKSPYSYLALFLVLCVGIFLKNR